MASVKSQIEDFVVAWLKATGATGGATLADDEVIVTRQGVPRPDAPYLGVRVITPDIPRGGDEQVHGISGSDPTVYVEGIRRATVSVQAFGDAAIEWLERATLKLNDPEVLRTVLDNGTTGLTLLPNAAGAVDVGAPIDTGWEDRVARDYDAIYKVDTSDDPSVLVEALTVEPNITLEEFDGDPDPVVISDTITL